MVGRIAITDITPVVGSTRLPEMPAKAVVDELVPVSAVVFREGHDAIGATVVLRAPDHTTHARLRMRPGEPGSDRWHATLRPDRAGPWTFTIEGWSDPVASWHQAVTAKLADGQQAPELDNDLELGARLFQRLARTVPIEVRPRVLAAVWTLRDQTRDLPERAAPAYDAMLERLAYEYPLREFVTASPRFPLQVDRPRALFSSWYEFFPRSIGAELAGDQAAPARPLRHGTLKDATEHLDYVASLGVDVVYLPPIHPIGTVNRKGANNALVAAPWDVGSPWAIGSQDGGHDAVHPELGTRDDFVAFVRRARELDLEVALDLALQCAPDHPWVESHPEWFTTRPDGTIAYAENPPKRYQDIYPLNFDHDPGGLYAECLRIVQHWIDAGVTIFRVDNPHTKPINFWQWLLAEVRQSNPEVLFLAEAFTRPAMMHELAKVGFHQSYTYYTWRNTKAELTSHMDELLRAAHYLRPNLFVNTPDILSQYLQEGGPNAFAIRAILAATLSPSWGLYSGYELFENQPLHPGSEEYLDSEKYQLRPRDFAAPRAKGRSLAPLITALNRIRREHPALQQLRNIYFHPIDHDELICFSKHDPTTSDTILIVCTLNPHHWREATATIDLSALGLDPAITHFTVHDLLDGATYTWGQANYVHLDPSTQPAHLFTVTSTTDTAD